MFFLSSLLENIPCKQFIGDCSIKIDKILPFEPANENKHALFWCHDKALSSILNLEEGTIICSNRVLDLPVSSAVNLIIVENPRQYFAKVTQWLTSHHKKSGISQTAVIHPSVVLGKDCYIGEYVVIEENCNIGDGCSIYHHSVIMKDTILKNNVSIGSHCTIGGVGFGYEKNETGDYILIHHLGNVMIDSHVDIGNNTCIDRAVLGSTHIGKNVKIDNLVHIAHGVFIDDNALIIANAMIAGSVKIGKNAWIAPSAAVMNKVSIGDNAIVGLSAVVIKSVSAHATVVGNPAKELNPVTD